MTLNNLTTEYSDFVVDVDVTNEPSESISYLSRSRESSAEDVRLTVLKLVRKSVAAVVALLLIVVSAGALAVLVLTRNSSGLEAEYREMSRVNTGVLANALASDLAVRSYLLSGESTFANDFERTRADLLESVANLEIAAAKIGDQGLIELAKNSSSIVTIWLDTFVDRSMGATRAETPRGDQLVGAELISNLRAVNMNIDSLVRDFNAKLLTNSSDLQRLAVIFAGLVLLAAFAMIVVILRRQASKIALALTHTVNDHARGLPTLVAENSESNDNDDVISNGGQSRTDSVIKQKAFRPNDYIEDMLILSRIDSNEIRFKIDTFDIRNLVYESIDGFQALADSRNLTIDVVAGDAPLLVCGDEEQTLRAVGSVISNALKFSRLGGRIEITVRQASAESGRFEAAVTVKDYGIGIVERDLPFIGKRYVRSSNAIAAEIPGMGVGLTIVGFIVHELGGTWSLKSSESVGTSVEIRLPLSIESSLSALANLDSTKKS